MMKFSKDEKVWVTSDLHLFHQKSFCYAPRGYSNGDEMTNGLINKFNEVVESNDTVFCLGDCVMGSIDEGKIIQTLEKLNGHIYLILGNHDGNKKIEAYQKCKNITVIGYAALVKWGKQCFYLSHYPTLCDNYTDEESLESKVLNICGHRHTQDKFFDFDKGFIYHCEVDAHNGYPVTLEQVIKDIKLEKK